MISQTEVNRYINDYIQKSNNKQLKSVRVSLSDDLIQITADLIPNKIISDVTVIMNFVLETFEFRPGLHFITFKLIGSPKVTGQGRVKGVLLKFIASVIDKTHGITKIVSDLVSGFDFISADDERVTVLLDALPAFQKMLDKRVPLIGARYLDYVGIKEIIIRQGEVALKPEVYTGKGQKLEDVKIQDQLGEIKTEMVQKSKKLFYAFCRKIKVNPDVMQDVVVNKLWVKVKRNIENLGEKLLEGICFLWDAMLDPEVPRDAKIIAVAALLYFISPVDVIPDMLGPLGFVDDAAVISAAFSAVDVILHQHNVNLQKRSSVT